MDPYLVEQAGIGELTGKVAVADDPHVLVGSRLGCGGVELADFTGEGVHSLGQIEVAVHPHMVLAPQMTAPA